MKTSTPEQPKKREPRSILLIGPPGGFKTTLLLQFPNVAIADCDMNLDGAERIIRKGLITKEGATIVAPINTQLTYKHITVPIDENNRPRDTSDCYDALMIALNDFKYDDTIQTVGVDGLSIINEWIIRKILKNQSRTEMEARDWIPFKSHAMGLINRLRMLGKDAILTCHETINTRNNPKNMMEPIITSYTPTIQGGIGDYFSGFFTDVWRITCERAPGDKLESVLTPVRTAYSDLKNSLGLPNELRNYTYKDLQPYLEDMK